MSDTKREPYVPLTESEMRQVEEGLTLTIRQPVNAVRYLKALIMRMNSACMRISELEERLDSALKAGKPASTIPAPAPAKTVTTSTTATKRQNASSTETI